MLYDRIIEAVAGWAGYGSHVAFVREHLLPWWAYVRIRNSIVDAGMSLYWDHPYRCRPEGSDERGMWDEIIARESLRQMSAKQPTLNLSAIVAETPWLLTRTPHDSDLGRRLVEIDRNTRSGRATLQWWKQLSERGRKLEARRIRTRNAVKHGGAFAPRTVEVVAPFAASLASEALGKSFEGSLTGRNLIEHFLDRQTELDKVRARLKANESPADALFNDAD